MRRLTVKRNGSVVWEGPLVEGIRADFVVLGDGWLVLPIGGGGVRIAPPYTVEVTEDTEAAQGGGLSGATGGRD